jgi:hypothetical protein
MSTARTSEFAVGLEEKGKGVLQQSLPAAVESDLPEVWLSRVDGLFAKTATRRTGVNGSLVSGNVISSAETSRSWRC